MIEITISAGKTGCCSCAYQLQMDKGYCGLFHKKLSCVKHRGFLAYYRRLPECIKAEKE